MSDYKETEYQQLTLFAEDSRARTSALPEKEKDLKENDQDFGSSFTVSSKKSSRNTRSLKTSQPFALEDWTKCSGRSLRSGMMRNGTVFPLQPLALLTAGTESGLWLTPTATQIPPRSKEAMERKAQKRLLTGRTTCPAGTLQEQRSESTRLNSSH